MERKQLLQRITFPQLSWQVVKNSNIVKTQAGDSVMVDAWFAIIRKPNRVPDFFFAFSWGLITGVEHAFHNLSLFLDTVSYCRTLVDILLSGACFLGPTRFSLRSWLFTEHRDVDRGRQKYGEAWKQYEKNKVPYSFMPVRLSCALLTTK